MNYIIILILTIILLILIILYIGLKIKIKYKIIDSNTNLKIQVKILKIPIYKSNFPKKDTQKEEDDLHEKEDKNNHNQKIKKLIPLLKKSKNEIITIIKIFKVSTKILKFKNYIKIGLDDYVKTVEIIGYLRIISSILNISDKNTLIAEAEFENETINIEGELKFKINLLNFIIKILKNKQTRNFVKKLIGAYIK